jgi:hypothetical protein
MAAWNQLVNVERRAPQGSCLGLVMHVICRYDLPEHFRDPTHFHAYVDDIAIVYVPSIHPPEAQIPKSSKSKNALTAIC